MTTFERIAEELTSAEAGFLYAARRRRCESSVSEGPQVDEVAAPPLARAWSEVMDEGCEEQTEELKVAGLRMWWRRGAFGACEDRRRVLQWALKVVDGEEEIYRARAAMARRELRRMTQQLGGDLSPMGKEVADIRRWLGWEHKEQLGVRLVVVGGVLVGALKQAVIRRRVAALLRQLPPAVHDRVRRGLQSLSSLDEAVERRVYEVYRRISQRGHRADEELAIIGLFFLVNAAVFRQNAALDRLEKMLPHSLAARCRAFREACIRSRKPELSVAVADTLQVVMAAMEQGEEDG